MFLLCNESRKGPSFVVRIVELDMVINFKENKDVVENLSQVLDLLMT